MARTGALTRPQRSMAGNNGASGASSPAVARQASSLRTVEALSTQSGSSPSWAARLPRWRCRRWIRPVAHLQRQATENLIPEQDAPAGCGVRDLCGRIPLVPRHFGRPRGSSLTEGGRGRFRWAPPGRDRCPEGHHLPGKRQMSHPTRRPALARLDATGQPRETWESRESAGTRSTPCLAQADCKWFPPPGSWQTTADRQSPGSCRDRPKSRLLNQVELPMSAACAAGERP